MTQLVDTYGEDVQVQFIHNPLSFHDNAMIASLASMAAARQGKFWEFHDTLFANQQALDEPNLIKYATELGLDVEKFKTDLKDAEIKKKVEADQAASVAVGQTGTPGFFVNGTLLSGAKPYEEFKTIVDAELTKVNQLIAGGVPREKAVYASMKKNNDKVFNLLIRNMPAGKAKPAPGEDKSLEVWKVVVRGDEPSKGPANAPVTIVEWSDFQCPFCSKVVETVNKVHEEYKDKVRIVFKHNPLSFHDKAQLAAEASMAAHAQGKFWEYHDVLFANQQALERANLETYAEEVGLDMEKFRAALDQRTYEAYAKNDAAQAADVNASGTPTFFVNGRLLGGKSFDDFKTIIDEELEKTQKLIDKGTSADKVYEKIISKGKVFSPLEDKVNSISVDGSPSLGNAPAKISIVEFSEFQCPFCSRVGPGLKEVKKIYGDDVSITFKHFPLNFHKEAFGAAVASMAAHQQGKFWEYHDVLFNNQKALFPADLELYAQQIGLDMEKFKQDINSEALKAKVNKDMAEGSRIGVNGTPSVFINGRKFSPPGGYSAESFQQAIDKYILKK